MKYGSLSQLCVSSALLIASIGFCGVEQAKADSYATRQARSYITDAEYKMRSAENLRRDADYYKRQAESYQREASYYTRQGKGEKAKEYLRKAEKAMDTYNSKMRDAKRADLDAADYLRKAANKLSY